MLGKPSNEKKQDSFNFSLVADPPSPFGYFGLSFSVLVMTIWLRSETRVLGMGRPPPPPQRKNLELQKIPFLGVSFVRFLVSGHPGSQLDQHYNVQAQLIFV